MYQNTSSATTYLQNIFSGKDPSFFDTIRIIYPYTSKPSFHEFTKCVFFHSEYCTINKTNVVAFKTSYLQDLRKIFYVNKHLSVTSLLNDSADGIIYYR